MYMDWQLSVQKHVRKLSRTEVISQAFAYDHFAHSFVNLSRLHVWLSRRHKLSSNCYLGSFDRCSNWTPRLFSLPSLQKWQGYTRLGQYMALAGSSLATLAEGPRGRVKLTHRYLTKWPQRSTLLSKLNLGCFHWPCHGRWRLATPVTSAKHDETATPVTSAKHDETTVLKPSRHSAKLVQSGSGRNHGGCERTLGILLQGLHK